MLLGSQSFVQAFDEVVWFFRADGKADEVAIDAETVRPVQLWVVSEEHVGTGEGERCPQTGSFGDP